MGNQQQSKMFGRNGYAQILEDDEDTHDHDHPAEASVVPTHPAVQSGDVYMCLCGEEFTDSFSLENHQPDCHVHQTMATTSTHGDDAEVSTGAFQSGDSVREQCALFETILEAHEVVEAPGSNELLQELRRALERGQAELHSRISMAQDGSCETEVELMECLELNDVIDAALVRYHATVEEYEAGACRRARMDARIETGTEEELNTVAAEQRLKAVMDEVKEQLPTASSAPTQMTWPLPFEDSPSVAPSTLESDLMDLLGGPVHTSTSSAPEQHVAVTVVQPLVKTASAQHFEDFFANTARVEF